MMLGCALGCVLGRVLAILLLLVVFNQRSAHRLYFNVRNESVGEDSVYALELDDTTLPREVAVDLLDHIVGGTQYQEQLDGLLKMSANPSAWESQFHEYVFADQKLLVRSKYNNHSFNMPIGRGTYGVGLQVEWWGVSFFSDETQVGVSIGRYCSIGKNPILVLDGNHCYRRVSTYPWTTQKLPKIVKMHTARTGPEAGKVEVGVEVEGAGGAPPPAIATAAELETETATATATKTATATAVATILETTIATETETATAAATATATETAEGVNGKQSYRLYELSPDPRDECSHPPRPITIGNDVWIADHVTIMMGVTVGDGAVIGAYSVVRSDVEPYSIVIGNPAVHVKYRFDDPALIAELLRIRWWLWPLAVLQRHLHLFLSDEPDNVAAFVAAAREVRWSKEEEDI